MSAVAVAEEAQIHDDNSLMSQVRGGSVAAFEELYDRYCLRAYRVARAICHDPGNAEDAVQAAFLSVWRGRRTQRGTVAAWLLTTVLYRAVDAARRDHEHTNRRVAENTRAVRPTPRILTKQVVDRDGGDRLPELLARIPDAQREVIALVVCGELTHTEIAVALDLPTSTVKSRMRLGLQALHTHVEKHAA